MPAVPPVTTRFFGRGSLSLPAWGISTTAQVPEPDTGRPEITVHRIHKVKEHKIDAVVMGSSLCSGFAGFSILLKLKTKRAAW